MKLFIIFLIYLLFVIEKTNATKEEDEDDVSKNKLSGDTIGKSLISTYNVVKPMKRPLKWFVNVVMQKPNEKYFKEAEYNGLRYQTEKLRESIDNDFYDYKKEYYNQKLKNFEQLKIVELRARKKLK